MCENIFINMTDEVRLKNMKENKINEVVQEMVEKLDISGYEDKSILEIMMKKLRKLDCNEEKDEKDEKMRRRNKICLTKNYVISARKKFTENGLK